MKRVSFFILGLVLFLLAATSIRADWYLGEDGSLYQAKLSIAELNIPQGSVLGEDDDLPSCEGDTKSSEDKCEGMCGGPCIKCKRWWGEKRYMCASSGNNDTPTPTDSVSVVDTPTPIQQEQPTNTPEPTPTDSTVVDTSTPTPTALPPAESIISTPAPTSTPYISQDELEELNAETNVSTTAPPPSTIIRFENKNEELSITKQEVSGETVDLGIQKTFVIEERTPISFTPPQNPTPTASIQVVPTRGPALIQHEQFIDQSLEEKLKSVENIERAITVQAAPGGLLVFKKGAVSARTKLPLSVLVSTSNLLVETKSGFKHIATLPGDALNTVIADNALSQVDTSAPFSLISKQGIPVYRINGKRTGKFLGFIPVSIEKKVAISAESGKLFSDETTNAWGFVLDKLSL